ncbi:CPBP family intramembrane glutamic endopeptidase [Mongoliitalea daihaiensis]|uniref:CPBP family intramembrane glutamic endopeptidase n=1 Tax=Mongoliitalea daihaiensis TaxID=2782006 RepID=UPI001F36FE3A|nr:CPBP family intramembrane glutamic endopeptidase [Mongoliitalea daihaiensis]UJP65369.1 CPBP family intramembrane metalloprotease [Mongoliitalea daihaiensis]
MQIYKTQSSIATRSNWILSLVVLILITFGVMAVLQSAAVFLVPVIFNIPLDETIAIFTSGSSHPKARMAFLFVQGFGGGFAFLAGGLLYAKLIDQADFFWKQQVQATEFKSLILMVLILTTGIVFNAVLIDWNASVVFPEFLADIEQYLRQKENQLMELTKFLTDFDSISEVLAGILVIGILAGLGEEVFFRGVLQPKLTGYFNNPHVAVWVTAIIFSAIHLQFYGFVPRVFLGAIFGYLYLYSGSLVYPILAHILNNTFTVVMLYLNKLGILEFDLEESGQVPLLTALLGLLGMIFLFRVFKKQHSQETSHG